MGEIYYHQAMHDVIQALDNYRAAYQQQVFEDMHKAEQQFIRAITYLIHDGEDD
jgi:hypothetical protein